MDQGQVRGVLIGASYYQDPALVLAHVDVETPVELVELSR
jgi:hypothetical protein